MIISTTTVHATGTPVEICYDLPTPQAGEDVHLCQCCSSDSCCSCQATQFWGPITVDPTPTVESCNAYCQAVCSPATDAWSSECTMFNDCTTIIKDFKDQQNAGARGITSDCFPAEAQVILEGGAAKRMDELEIGDNVQSGPNTFSRIVAFTHRDKSALDTQYISAITASGQYFTASRGHYISVASSDAKMIAMHKLSPGDFILNTLGLKEEVTSVQPARSTGALNPQTSSGYIVVDGVQFSCYTEAVHPVLAHALLAPVRLMAWLTGYAVDPLGGFLNEKGRVSRFFAFVVPGTTSIQ
eukprot:CAMPEP_0174892134 /NCGR_PEP_ID=MMETSP0167-20121228/7150_1 /TAXON_ID=38298 /ORGANISM="Rhodella maculata, Strain CCMP736" /LENGTH=298 /DNA_ID=CAMNT_0016130547 /DNA_START=194 /DNA_END=1090 /DNA_ORIENTATION=-